VCEWSYLEISKKLFQSDKIKSHPILSRWIRTYLSQDYKVLVNALRGFLDDIAKSSSAQEKEKMKNLFILGSKYEYMFWEGVYNQERWQI
jgi:thiaminase/transcriptional activator TenA